ncbi:hypothetical protein RFF05_11675 [Bengtsoniella intestinalis]|uniref:hypothetical protein n=1 Tax=Bengtsoniella intestinalis TaxID=3073143 RepID=UPI00391F2B37
MKKLFALLLAATMILSLVACANADSTQDDVEQDVTGETEILDPDNTEIPNMNELDGEQAVASLPDDDFTENVIVPETVGEPETAPESTATETVPEATTTPK